MIKKLKQFYAYIAVVFAMFFWGLSFVWSKLLLNNDFNVIFIVTTRLVISFLLLFIVFRIVGKVEKVKRRDIPNFLLLAFFEPFLYFIGENYGLEFVDASFAAIFISIIPMVIPFVLRIFIKEKLQPAIIVGVLVSIVGILVMSLDNNGFSFDVSLSGVLLLSLAVLSAAGYSVMLSKVLNYSPVTITIYQNLIASCYYLPLFFFIPLDSIWTMNWNFDTMFALLMLSVFCSSIAFIGYSYAAKRISIANASVFTNTIPIVTIAFAVFIGQETLTLHKVVGASIVIGGVFFSQAVKKKNFLKKN
jgi:drug/metabolite transporter (DMT)-like permease